MVFPCTAVCISLLVNGAQHLFTGLSATGVFSLENCLFRPFAHVLIKYFVSLWLSCKSSLCSLNTRSSSDARCANIFSHCMVVFHFLDVF